MNSAPAPTDPAQMNGQQAEQQIETLLPQLSMGGSQASQAHDQITSIMAARLNIDKQEASNRLDKTQAQIDQTKSQATTTAKQAADTASAGLTWASLLAFAALLVGAIAAAFGGSLGARAHHTQRSEGIRRVARA